MDRYCELNRANPTNNRFLHYVDINASSGNWYIKDMPIGKNVIAKIGVKLAQLLEKPEPEKYTGHCWRRTAITVLANSGASADQIMAASGIKVCIKVQYIGPIN